MTAPLRTLSECAVEPRTRGPAVRHDPWPLAGIVVLAALLRFSTLGDQLFWVDEAVTAGLLELDLADMLRTIPATESTPPLYYALAWLWSTAFGTGEFAVRSLSALAGTAAIPVIYAAAAEFVSRRAALLTAGLAAVSPVLVWYSQEARAYSLLVLMGAVTVLYFGRALKRPGRATLVPWSIACASALATHYFAGFLVAGEAAWLLYAHRLRAGVVLACVPIAVVAAGLAPLALHQSRQGNLDFLGDRGWPSRTFDAAKMLVVGPPGVAVRYAAVMGLALVAVALAQLVFRTTARERRAVVPVAAIAIAAVGLPVMLALAGSDYILARNLLPIWVPAAVLVAAGLGASRAGTLGTVAAVALLLLSLTMCVAVPATQKLRREAINAQLLNYDGQDAAVEIAYVRLEPGQQRSATLECPADYDARTVETFWVGAPPAEGRLVKRRVGRAWTARVTEAPERVSTYQVTVGCAPATGGTAPP